jgi:hypothetical protein
MQAGSAGAVPTAARRTRTRNRMEHEPKGMDAMNNPPLCQFGPGGDYVRPWPKESRVLHKAHTPAELARIEARALDRIAQDLGLEAPLVSTGPSGIQWPDLPRAVEDKQDRQARGVVRSVLDVLRAVHKDANDAEQADAKLVAEQIARADQALDALCEMEAELAEVAVPTAQAPTAEESQENIAEEHPSTEQPYKQDECVLATGRAALVAVAMETPVAERVDAKDPYCLANRRKESENHHGENRHAETNGYSAVHSGLPSGEWLFPHHAGNRRSSGSHQGHGVRARRSTRKKGTAAAGRQAQGSLFANLP